MSDIPSLLDPQKREVSCTHTADRIAICIIARASREYLSTTAPRVIIVPMTQLVQFFRCMGERLSLLMRARNARCWIYFNLKSRRRFVDADDGIVTLPSRSCLICGEVDAELHCTWLRCDIICTNCMRRKVKTMLHMYVCTP